MMLASIARQGLRIEEIDGIEVFGMHDDGEVQERAQPGYHPDVNVFGISVHKIGGGLYEIGGDYSSAQEAVAVAEKLYVTLRSQVPHEIHFIDET